MTNPPTSPYQQSDGNGEDILSVEPNATRSTNAIITRVLLLISILLEVGVIIKMTSLRYGNQRLEPIYFNVTKTGDVLGMLLVLPIIVVLLIHLFRHRSNSPGNAIIAASLSFLSFILLFIIPNLSPLTSRYVSLAYLIFMALFFSILVVMLAKGSQPLWRRIMKVTVLTILLSGGAYVLTIASVLIDPIAPSPSIFAGNEKFDAGVILGAAVWSRDKPSPVLRERIKKGHELLTNGRVEFLVLTGGHAPSELSEAEVAKRELLKLGVDPTRIVLEDQTSSTVEQMRFIRDVLTQQGWHSFLIISDQFHLTRALEICEFNDITAEGVPSESPLGPYNLAIYHLRESFALMLFWFFGL